MFSYWVRSFARNTNAIFSKKKYDVWDHTTEALLYLIVCEKKSNKYPFSYETIATKYEIYTFLVLPNAFRLAPVLKCCSSVAHVVLFVTPV